jgi:peroxiredoxin
MTKPKLHRLASGVLLAGLLAALSAGCGDSSKKYMPYAEGPGEAGKAGEAPVESLKGVFTPENAGKLPATQPPAATPPKRVAADDDESLELGQPNRQYVSEINLGTGLVTIKIPNCCISVGQHVRLTNQDNVRLLGVVVNNIGKSIVIRGLDGPLDRFRQGDAIDVENDVAPRGKRRSARNPQAAENSASGVATLLRVGEPAPDFVLHDINAPEGTLVRLSEYAGPATPVRKPVLLAFWTSWSDECRNDVPLINELHRKYGRGKVVVLSVLLESGSVEGVKPMIERMGIRYPVLLDRDLNISTERYALSGVVPLYVVVGPDGIVRYIRSRELKEILREVEAALR